MLVFTTLTLSSCSSKEEKVKYLSDSKVSISCKKDSDCKVEPIG